MDAVTQKQHHAARRKAEHEAQRANATKHYIGAREIEIVRDAEPDDPGFNEAEACSVVRVVATGVERVVMDKDIQIRPAI